MELNRDQVVRKLVINPLVRRLRASYERIFHQIESRESELTIRLRSLQECISLPREELGCEFGDAPEVSCNEIVSIWLSYDKK